MRKLGDIDASTLTREAQTSAFLSEPSRPPVSTRERILYATSVLLTARGFKGTSTRAIGRAVGIQAPSLYHHFESKEAIVEELLDYSLNASVSFAEMMMNEPGDAAVRLFRHIRFDHARLSSAVYDLRGIHNEYLLSRPRFALWRNRFDRLRSDVRELVREGIESGRFIPVDLALVQDAISGLVLHTFSSSPQAESAGRNVSEAAASLVLRALLIAPNELSSIRKEAMSHQVEDDQLLTGGVVLDGPTADNARKTSEPPAVVAGELRRQGRDGGMSARDGRGEDIAALYGRLPEAQVEATRYRALLKESESPRESFGEEFQRLRVDVAKGREEMAELRSELAQLKAELQHTAS